MTDGPLELRVFGLDFAVNVQPERRDAVARQWSWCLPDAPSQRTIAPLTRAPHRMNRASGAPDTSDTDGSVGPDVAAEPAGPAPHVVERGDDAPGAVADISDYTLTTTLTGRAISLRAGELVMLHAGGVCDPATGVVAGLVAASGTGKTTATRHYCTHGYGYVTDETLIFNDRREVLPYPKPLSVLGDPAVTGVKTQYCPTDLGMAPPHDGALRLGPLVLLDRIREPERSDDPDASGEVVESAGADAESDVPGAPVGMPEGGADLVEVPLFEALTLILPQSSAMPQIDGCLDLIARLALAGGGVHRLRYREIADTMPLLRKAFALPAQEPFWRHVPGTWWTDQPDVDPYAPRAPGPVGDDDSTDDATLTPDATLTLAPFVDALVDDEALQVLTLVGSVPAHLHGLGAVIHMTLLDGPRSITQLVTACTEELGAHPDATALVTQAARELLANGVVRVVSADEA